MSLTTSSNLFIVLCKNSIIHSLIGRTRPALAARSAHIPPRPTLRSAARRLLSRCGTLTLGATALGAISPHFPMHHSTSLAAIREQDTEEHEETSDEDNVPRAYLALFATLKLAMVCPAEDMVLILPEEEELMRSLSW
eukprot:CAMPEP_0196168524 /NCGR_PEP_ID=MMETSP0911-20130528/3259_1 /TAXON_ID=49265 /ORGANISM="Thalassiosira rotula, Strain GSO102" /LENGTH=137 /DNA_ID=CAMNT_0041434531 /DNA_START=148 /DNA_END=559 /DNA_ORIENTATION=+